MKVTVDDSFDSADTAKEARLAGALSSGKAQLGYLPARDWATDGLPAFQALSAPFAVTTQEAMQDVATSDFAHDALASLKDRHVVGLGLVPVEPRQLLSRRPIVAQEDFRSASLRVVLNPALAGAVSALGGTPADVRDSSRVRTLLWAGKLTGAETSPQYALSNGYVSAAPYLTAFGLYAKFQVVAVSEKAWAGLDDAQRAALRKAADDTVAHAQDMPDPEADELAALCRQHAVVTPPTDAEIAAIAAAARTDAPTGTPPRRWRPCPAPDRSPAPCRSRPRARSPMAALRPSPR